MQIGNSHGQFLIKKSTIFPPVLETDFPPTYAFSLTIEQGHEKTYSKTNEFSESDICQNSSLLLSVHFYQVSIHNIFNILIIIAFIIGGIFVVAFNLKAEKKFIPHWGFQTLEIMLVFVSSYIAYFII